MRKTFFLQRIVLLGIFLIPIEIFAQQQEKLPIIEKKQDTELQQNTTDQRIQDIRFYEKVLERLNQEGPEKNKHSRHTTLLNLADINEEIGDKEKSAQYKKELEQLEKNYPELKIPDETRKHIERYIQQNEIKLQEYRQGKRDYRDAYLILRILQANHMKLREKNRAKQYTTEIQNLKSEYSNLVTTPPQELSEQRKEREELERKKEELKKKPFVPKDSRAMVFQYGNRVAAVYQYRIEFYELPKEVNVYFLEEDNELRKFGEPYSPIAGTIKFYSDNSMYEVKSKRKFDVEGIKVYQSNSSPHPIRPKQILTFKKRIEVEPKFPLSNQESILVCTIPGLGYGAVGNQEGQEIALRLGHWGLYPWENKDGQYDEFYGVINMLGEIIYEIPFKSDFPNTLLTPIDITSDGKKALCGIGKAVESGVGYIREFIVWEFPNYLKRISRNSKEGLKIQKKLNWIGQKEAED